MHFCELIQNLFHNFQFFIENVFTVCIIDNLGYRDICCNNNRSDCCSDCNSKILSNFSFNDINKWHRVLKH